MGPGKIRIADADDRDIIGNGRAIFLLFGREGAHVACIDINRESAETTATRVKDEGGKAFVEVADVGDADAIAPLVDRCRTQLGGLDGLVLNVGISKGLRLDGMTAEIWDRDFAVNVRSNRLFAQKALEVIEPGATIVILSSLASFRAVGRNPAYETSKAAQVALSRSIARAGEPKGIRCNSIAPGYVDTPMGRDASRRRPDRAVQVPFGRQATGWEGRIRGAIPDVARVLICQRALPRSGRWAPLRHRQRVSRRG
jgi:NAD(P)-dependent dehydrogenase (short-subunit alcohol dehydrogenase family)